MLEMTYGYAYLGAWFTDSARMKSDMLLHETMIKAIARVNSFGYGTGGAEVWYRTEGKNSWCGSTGADYLYFEVWRQGTGLPDIQ
ncbi:hypothetical protein E2C01_031200 [Portunus trituberculatus]|uniref:Uncharacterized protein n=1 Tax=Portunus trituberculatus TaxID=210409 RepID=A0A5B7ESE0_PORTR|nr:hypothetical protein [Portunus trituberculatus]